MFRRLLRLVIFALLVGCWSVGAQGAAAQSTTGKLHTYYIAADEVE